jgi:hypothetical protein
MISTQLSSLICVLRQADVTILCCNADVYATPASMQNQLKLTTAQQRLAVAPQTHCTWLQWTGRYVLQCEQFYSLIYMLHFFADSTRPTWLLLSSA